MNKPIRNKPDNPFVRGAVSPRLIAATMEKHSAKTSIGACNIFLGKVRNDVMDGKEVKAIEYTAYEAMAEKEIRIIMEEASERFDLVCMHIYHSLGLVEAGGISLFIYVTSAHRQASYKACLFLLESIKNRVPVFGKEIFKDATHQWKKNQ